MQERKRRSASGRGLGSGHLGGAERPRIRVLDRAWLDDKPALQLDLEASFILDDLRESARESGAKPAFLAGGTEGRLPAARDGHLSLRQDDARHRVPAAGE